MPVRGWLIFAVPPAELAVHPGEAPTFDAGVRHEISFMCDDLKATMADLRFKGVQFDGEPDDRRYGIVVTMALPGGVKALFYEPRHPLATNLPPKALKMRIRRRTRELMQA